MAVMITVSVLQGNIDVAREETSLVLENTETNAGRRHIEQGRHEETNRVGIVMYNSTTGYPHHTSTVRRTG